MRACVREYERRCWQMGSKSRNRRMQQVCQEDTKWAEVRMECRVGTRKWGEEMCEGVGVKRRAEKRGGESHEPGAGGREAGRAPAEADACVMDGPAGQGRG